MRNWLEGRSQRVTVNGSMSKWMPMTSGVPQRSVLKLALLNIFINDINTKLECTLSKFADDPPKLSGTVDTSEGWYVIQRDLDTLEKKACMNLMRFNKVKCKVLHLGRDNSLCQCILGEEGIESSLSKGLRRVTWGYWWKKSWT